MKKIIVLLGIFILTVAAYARPTVETNKVVYSTNEAISVDVSNMLGDVKDWIAIYPSGSTNAWENVLRWSWTDGFINGNKTFESLAVGEYEARVFFKNSYKLEASSSFSVETNVDTLSLTTSKTTYVSNEKIVVDFKNMLGDQQDWIAIYPKGSSNEWENVLRWKWTEGVKTGSFSFEALAKGEYEARAFFKNSYKLEATTSFVVADAVTPLSLSTSKTTYASNEKIVVDFKNMLGDQQDWIAIYPKGSSNEWENVLRWKWTEGVKTGSFSFEALAKGEYEARAFFKNSYKLEASSSFTVSDVSVDKDAFIATWEIGASKSLQLATVERYNYNFNVDWGDGTTNQNITSTIIHNYESEGNYTVHITGVYPQPTYLCFLGFDDQGAGRIGYQKLVSLEQWGTQKWKSMHTAFADCKDFNIINDPKAPDLSNVTSTVLMFNDATKFNQPIGHWDVSSVTNMDRMFLDASSFNQDVSTWDISNVKYLHFNGSTLSTENYDKLLIAWSQLNVQDNVSFGTAPTHYTTQAISARQRLIDEFNWGIFDAGLIN